MMPKSLLFLQRISLCVDVFIGAYPEKTMDDRNTLDQVLLAIFQAAGRNADIAVDDPAWMKNIQPALRQEAVETSVVRLAQNQFIRREAGMAGVTAKGLQYIYSHSKAWRNAA